MKGTSLVVAAGLVVVALAAFLLGRSAPRPLPVATPETGGTPAESPLPKVTPAAKPPTPRQAPAATPDGPAVTLPPTAKEGPAAEPSQSQDQTSAVGEPEVTVEKPKGAEWVMTSNPRFFRDPVHHPGKRLEIRREPKGDERFAMIELYVLDLPAGSTEVQEVERIERIGRRAKFGTFKVLEEGPVQVGGQTMTRRVTYWDARGTPLEKQAARVAESKFVSLRAVRGGKLCLLIAYSPAEHFAALLPEFEQVMETLRVR